MSKFEVEESLKQKLAFAKEEYNDRKEYFLLSTRTDVDSMAFEQNAISALAAMLECKARIKTLEETIATIGL